MTFLTPLLIGAAAGAAGTWAYLRRQPKEDESNDSVVSVIDEAVSDAVTEAESIDATAVTA